MKNYFLLLLFLVSTLICKGQIEIERGKENNLPKDFYNSGLYYYKDVNGYLDYFEGTWEYVNGNKKFEIILEKITKHHTVTPDVNLYEDGIGLSYKLYENNTLVYSSPLDNYPSLYAKSGTLLQGLIIDYGRLTEAYSIPSLNISLDAPGGEPITPSALIWRVLNTDPNSPDKIHFEIACVFCGNYDEDAYQGEPYFSIPNDIALERVN